MTVQTLTPSIETRAQPTETALLSVVIPAYNDENGIAALIERVLAVQSHLRTLGIGLELLVVDDGSMDHTAEITATYDEVRLLRHNPNRGYGAALKTGFCAAEGDLLAFLDADGTYPPESLPVLCQEILDGADVAVGSRRSGAASEMPTVRRIGNFIWSNLVSALANQKVNDPASGMRVFRRTTLNRLYPLPDGLNFTPVMSTRAAHENLTVVEVPMPYKERQGRSKLSVVKDGMRFLSTIIWTALCYNPARILGGIGATLFVLSTLIALALVGVRLSGVTTLAPPGVFSTFLAVVLGIAGFTLFALGATFNYLVALFHKNPVRQGLFGKPIFDPPLDRQFWWMGLLSVAGGSGVGIVSLILGLNGWEIERLWLYLLAGTMLALMGLQLTIFWIIMRVLDELSQRDLMIQADLEQTYG